MSDLRSLLRDGDPSAAGTELDASQVARIRARILAVEPAPSAAGLRLTGALAVLLALVATGAGWFVHSTRSVSGETHLSERRQLYFSTPGGTRIIWIFNPDLEVR